MPPPALTVVPKTYAELRTAVVAVVVKGRAAIDRAWLETYHETGRLIHEHVLLNKDRAAYGAGVIDRLSGDTDIGSRTLRECVQFYRCYPNWRTCAKLGWAQCRLLCQVSDATQREKLRAEAVKKQWTVLELESRVRASNLVEVDSSEESAAKPIELLKPLCGTAGWRQIVDRGGGPVIDLGFMNYHDGRTGLKKGAASLRSYKLGDIVRFMEEGVERVADATRADLFTYEATIRKVIDGDTLLVSLALAPGWTRELKLRLRGLDCPEISTAAGRAAKAFVDGLIKVGDEVIICTTKPDKYDRYLADVFIAPKGAELSAIRDRLSTKLGDSADRRSLIAECFLNNLLLSGGYAVRYDGGAKEEV